MKGLVNMLNDTMYVLEFYNFISEYFSNTRSPVEVYVKELKDRYTNREYWDKLFSSLLRILNSFTYICNSDDINEDTTKYGDYSYYFKKMTDEMSCLFMMSSHPQHFPNRIIFYDLKMGIEVSQGIMLIGLTHMDDVLYEPILTLNNVKDYLQSYDRPLLEKESELYNE